jgi:membrane protease subunit HflK
MDTYKTPHGNYAPLKPPSAATIRKLVIGAGLLLLLLIGACTSAYTVDSEEQAVVLRFGRYVETAEPGLHMKLPFGVDQAITVPVAKNHKLEFGFSTAVSGVRTQYNRRSPEEHEVANMLTGDLNIADVEWVVQYRIKDARQWLFSVRNQESAIRDLSESVMRKVVGDHTISEVVTTLRDRIKGLVKSELQDSVDAYALGVHIETVELQNVTPPEKVRESFNEVNSAQQERSRLENEAERDRNSVIPRARGKAEKQIEEAEGYAIDRVNRAKGDVARFVELLAAYEESPEVTRQRLYLETVERVLPRVKRIVVADGDGVLKLLPIDGAGGGK